MFGPGKRHSQTCSLGSRASHRGLAPRPLWPLPRGVRAGPYRVSPQGHLRIPTKWPGTPSWAPRRQEGEQPPIWLRSHGGPAPEPTRHLFSEGEAAAADPSVSGWDRGAPRSAEWGPVPAGRPWRELICAPHAGGRALSHVFKHRVPSPPTSHPQGPACPALQGGLLGSEGQGCSRSQTNRESKQTPPRPTVSFSNSAQRRVPLLFRSHFPQSTALTPPST